jgi:hypothetical protein
MIRLLIRGSRFVAAHEIWARKFYGAEYKPTTSTPTLSVYYVPNFYLDRVAAWFAEPGKAPFPPGTLLHYVVPREDGASMAIK